MTAMDWFVGALAILLGAACLIGGALNAEAFYQLPKMRWIERHGGRAAARLVYILLGVGLIVLGTAIARGWRLLQG